ncbi:helix-turn-helix transcriptional regulator [Streptosporangiaceae bacterium NEAU-GS5]|nr:helix-turn-helix transcriptional regulator [Streptosporangiaceae bacterium NEAU-GS5]
MTESRSLARLAALLADATRAAFCLALLDGRAWTSGELARHAGVAPSTASEHVTRLVDGGLLAEVRQGRHRYLRLAGPDVAHLIEELSGHTPPDPAPPRTLRSERAAVALRRARTCYDHLAGRLGVAVTDAMAGRRLLDPDGGYALTGAGRAWLADLLGALPPVKTRPMSRTCVDWTERRPHLAGASGAALCAHAFDRAWIARIGSGRAVKVTPYGRQALADLLDLDTDKLDTDRLDTDRLDVGGLNTDTGGAVSR